MFAACARIEWISHHFRPYFMANQVKKKAITDVETGYCQPQSTNFVCSCPILKWLNPNMLVRWPSPLKKDHVFILIGCCVHSYILYTFHSNRIDWQLTINNKAISFQRENIKQPNEIKWYKLYTAVRNWHYGLHSDKCDCLGIHLKLCWPSLRFSVIVLLLFFSFSFFSSNSSQWTEIIWSMLNDRRSNVQLYKQIVLHSLLLTKRYLAVILFVQSLELVEFVLLVC